MIRIPQKKKISTEMLDEELTDSPIRSERLSEKPKEEKRDTEKRYRDKVGAWEEKKAYPKAEEPKERAAATSSAFRILQSGANSKKMLREKLLKKGYSKRECEAAIEECVALGFIKDGELLTAHTAFLAQKKHFGKSRIRMELLKKFDRKTVEDHFTEAIVEIDFLKNAREEALKLLHRGKAYLVRRLQLLGYSSSEIYEALKDLTFDTADAPSDGEGFSDYDFDET